MASRVPYDVIKEEQDDTIEKSQKPDGMSWREAEIEEVHFKHDNRLIVILAAVLTFFFLGIGPYIAEWSGSYNLGVMTCVVGIICVWIMTYYSYLRWKSKREL